MSDPYAAVSKELARTPEGEHPDVTAIVQAVIQALDYSSCIACPECGAEIDTRTAEKL